MIARSIEDTSPVNASDFNRIHRMLLQEVTCNRTLLVVFHDIAPGIAVTVRPVGAAQRNAAGSAHGLARAQRYLRRDGSGRGPFGYASASDGHEEVGVRTVTDVDHDDAAPPGGC